MPKNKTTPTEHSVEKFLNSVPDERKRKDSIIICNIMREETGLQPKMWGPAIIGYGAYHYKYESGHEGDAPFLGFSPRKDAIVLYLSNDFEGREELLKKFGKHKTGKVCIYLKKIEDIDISVLKEMVSRAFKHTKKRHS